MASIGNINRGIQSIIDVIDFNPIPHLGGGEADSALL